MNIVVTGGEVSYLYCVSVIHSCTSIDHLITVGDWLNRLFRKHRLTEAEYINLKALIYKRRK